MKILLTVSIIFLSITAAAQCGCAKDLLDEVDQDADQVEVLFDGGTFTEGPAISDNGFVYFSDLVFTEENPDKTGRILRYSKKNGETEVFKDPSGQSNGLAIRDNKIYVCQGADTGERRIISIDLSSKEEKVIADSFRNKKFNSPNDIKVSQEGEIYFTDPRYSGNENLEQEFMGVYKVSPSGKINLLIKDISMPNGISLSPDEKKLYVGCFEEEQSANPDLKNGNFIAEYQLKDSGNVEFVKYIAKFIPPTGPDGIEVDSKGNIYAAIRDEYLPGIYVYNIEGLLINKIILKDVPSNLEFDNEDENILYVTAGSGLYRITLNK